MSKATEWSRKMAGMLLSAPSLSLQTASAKVLLVDHRPVLHLDVFGQVDVTLPPVDAAKLGAWLVDVFGEVPETPPTPEVTQR